MADDRTPVPDAYRMLFNLSHLITIEDVTAESSEGSDLLEALKLEFLNNGVSVNQSFVCVVARQPI